MMDELQKLIEAVEEEKLRWAKTEEERRRWLGVVKRCKSHLQGEELQEHVPSWNGDPVGTDVAIGNVLGALRTQLAEAKASIAEWERLHELSLQRSNERNQEEGKLRTALREAKAEVERLREHERLTGDWDKGDTFDHAIANCVALRQERDELKNEVARLQLQGHSLFGKGQDALADEMRNLRQECTGLQAEIERCASERKLVGEELIQARAELEMLKQR